MPKSPFGLWGGLATSTHQASSSSARILVAMAAASRKSKSQKMSPFTTTKGPSPSSGRAWAMPPAVSRAVASGEYRMRAPRAPPSPRARSIFAPSQAWLTTMSRMPAATSASTWRAISERPPTSSSGLGTVSVSGRMRSPRPAARIIARGESEGVADTRRIPLDPVDEAREPRERAVAGQRPAQVAQHTRHVVEVAVLAVAMREPGEDAEHLELALHAHPFVVAVEVGEIGRHRQPRGAGGIPVANHPVHLALLRPVHVGIPKERDGVVRNGAFDRVLEVEDAGTVRVEHHQVAAVVVPVHMDDGLREDGVQQMVEGGAKPAPLVVVEDDTAVARDIPLGVEGEFPLEQGPVVGGKAAGAP